MGSCRVPMENQLPVLMYANDLDSNLSNAML
jgi:hypothetical protein